MVKLLQNHEYFFSYLSPMPRECFQNQSNPQVPLSPQRAGDMVCIFGQVATDEGAIIGQNVTEQAHQVFKIAKQP
ncbi:MAG: hypothetical protein R2865_08060 [Deinococcales bacterium]